MEKDPYSLFSEHHTRLLTRIDEFGKRVEEDVLNAPELLTCLSEQLLPHAQAEEATLYQRGATLPDGAALVQSLRQEHETLRQQIHEAQECFATRRDEALRNTIAALLVLLRTHFSTENDSLLPKLQRYLSPDEFRALLEEAHRLEQAGKPSDLGQFLQADHHRVDRIVQEFSLLKQLVLHRAQTAFTHGKHALLRHLTWEEDLLFPLFAEKIQGGDTGLTTEMRQEHAQLKAILEHIEHALQAGEVGALDVAERELVGLLVRHKRKEEEAFYPLINQRLSAQERETLLNRLK
jgi:hemerythrin-like domain-containing protein